MNQLYTKLAGIGLLLVAVFIVGRSILTEAETPATAANLPATGSSDSPFSGEAHGGPSRFANRTPNSTRQMTAGMDAAVISPDFRRLSPDSSTEITKSGDLADVRTNRDSASRQHSSQPSAEPLINAPASGPVSLSGGTVDSRYESDIQIEDHSAGQAPIVFPAALIELDLPAVSSPEATTRLGDLASEFAEALDKSAFDPASADYHQLWNRQQAIADARFRAMYGGHAWMAHHIQSHHALSNPSGQ